MKFLALAAAGLIAASATTPTPAEAQGRFGYDRGDRGGWHGDRRGWRDDRRGWRGRDRVRCRWVRSYYGPVQRCVHFR